MAMLF